MPTMVSQMGLRSQSDRPNAASAEPGSWIRLSRPVQAVTIKHHLAHEATAAAYGVCSGRICVQTSMANVAKGIYDFHVQSGVLRSAKLYCYQILDKAKSSITKGSRIGVH